MLILVTGATGAIGPRVVFALDQAGYRVRAFSVDTPAAGIFPQKIEIMTGDVTNHVAVRSAMQNVDAVIHMAGLLHLVNPPPDLCENIERINVVGTAMVVDAAISAGVNRVVLFSTIAVYGQSDGSILDEQSKTHTDNYYAQTKLSAERIVLDARVDDGQPMGTVLRLGAVYGSRIQGNYKQLTRALAHHRFIPVGNGLNRRTLVYDKDVGRAAALAVSHPAAAGRVFNVTDGEFHTMNEIIKSICSALGRKAPRLSLPSGFIRFVAGATEGGYHIFGLRSPITLEMVDKYTEDIAVNGSLIQKELGFVPKYDLQTGWEETIKEMREGGVL